MGKAKAQVQAKGRSAVDPAMLAEAAAVVAAAAKVKAPAKASVAKVSPNGPVDVAALVAAHTAARVAYLAAGGRWHKGQSPALLALGTALVRARNALRVAHGGIPVRQVYAKLGIQPERRARDGVAPKAEKANSA